MGKRSRASTNEQIQEIMNTAMYKKGNEFTVSDIIHSVQKVSCRQRMNALLNEMRSIGLLDKIKDNGLVRFKKPMSNLLKRRWVSEEAEDLCAGDHTGTITGQAARDVARRARALTGFSEATCGGGL